jgi:hypothetical protein
MRGVNRDVCALAKDHAPRVRVGDVTVDPGPLNTRSQAVKSEGLIVPVAPSVVIVPVTEPRPIVSFTLYTVAWAGEAATANIAAAQPSNALTIFTW